MITVMTDTQARKLLQSAFLGRLGCIANGEPYITPVNYNLEGDCIYSHSLPGLKITSLRTNPRACLQVDEIESDVCWSSVLAFGNFEEIAISTERDVVLGKLLKRFPMLTPVESALADDGSAPSVVVFRIRIERLSGLSEGLAHDKLHTFEEPA